MARRRRSSLNGRGMAGFDGFIYKKSHITLRSWLLALSFDPTTLIEIAVYEQQKIARYFCLKNFLQGFITSASAILVDFSPSL